MSWCDRCYTIDIVLNLEPRLEVFTIYISVLLPCFTLILTENGSNMYGMKIQYINDRISNEQALGLFHTIRKYLEARDYSMFPVKLLNEKIPDISYKNIKMGTFTYFNAFFLDCIPNKW